MIGEKKTCVIVAVFVKEHSCENVVSVMKVDKLAANEHSVSQFNCYSMQV